LRFFWAVCHGCGRFTTDGFCSQCVAEWRRVHAPCRRCGLASPVTACPRAHAPWHVSAVIAPFDYAAPLETYLQAFKYRGRRSLGRAFGALLAESARDADIGADVVVAVPLHPRRLRERGYNQALEIARPLAPALRARLVLGGLARRFEGSSQTQRGAAERRASVARAFVADRRFAGCAVLVVDDVLTTGATVNAVAAALLSAGALRVSVAAVARTPA
jgi:ComF family protein